jgi:hypothetical protein
MYADIGIDPAAAVTQWLEQNFTLHQYLRRNKSN